jgi:hypothetical protein
MTDADSGSADDAPTGARMTLEPDSIHEREDGIALDCPQCGATVTVMRVIETGRCPNYVAEDEVEVAADAGQVQDGPECTAELSLELVWEG